MNSLISRDLPTPASPTMRPLAVARIGLTEGPAQVLDLGVAADGA
jgi:hypothetical protein